MGILQKCHTMERMSKQEFDVGARRGTPWPGTRRLGDRKGVQAFHPPDGTPSLFAHLFRGTLRVPVLRGSAPAPRRLL